MKRKIKNIPILGELLFKIKYNLDKAKFKSSKDYWETRYSKGGNSGGGSYNHLAEFKAKILNDFVQKHEIKKIIELGSGDGNQLEIAKYPEYHGFDVSITAVNITRDKFQNDSTKSFHLMSELPYYKAELSLSLDVIYHLIEDDVYESYMQSLFDCSTRFVIIYSSNEDEKTPYSVHEKHRKFSTWIDANAKGWSFVEKIENEFPYQGDEMQGSLANFYIYKKLSTHIT